MLTTTPSPGKRSSLQDIPEDKALSTSEAVGQPRQSVRFPDYSDDSRNIISKVLESPPSSANSTPRQATDSPVSTPRQQNSSVVEHNVAEDSMFSMPAFSQAPAQPVRTPVIPPLPLAMVPRAQQSAQPLGNPLGNQAARGNSVRDFSERSQSERLSAPEPRASSPSLSQNLSVEMPATPPQNTGIPTPFTQQQARHSEPPNNDYAATRQSPSQLSPGMLQQQPVQPIQPAQSWSPEVHGQHLQPAPSFPTLQHQQHEVATAYPQSMTPFKHDPSAWIPGQQHFSGQKSSDSVAPSDQPTAQHPQGMHVMAGGGLKGPTHNEFMATDFSYWSNAPAADALQQYSAAQPRPRVDTRAPVDATNFQKLEQAWAHRQRLQAMVNHLQGVMAEPGKCR
jgi:hypothetical protein